MTVIRSPDNKSDNGQVIALNDMWNDFETKQRGFLRMEMEKAVTKTINKQSEMFEALRSKIETRHCNALKELRDDILRPEPSLLETFMSRTLDVQKNTGLVSWINDDKKKKLVQMYVPKLRNYLESGHANAFRSEFEALLVVYMECLEIPMKSGSRLSNRIEDLHQGLLNKAGSNGDLINLVHRVRWACFGVRAICNVRSHETNVLSENEILELCACFSAIGAAMPTLVLEFQVCQQPSVTASSSSSSAMSSPTNSNLEMGLAMLAQLRQSPDDKNDQTSFDYMFQLMTNNGSTASTTRLEESQMNQPSSLPLGFHDDGFSLSSQDSLQSRSPDWNDLNLTSLSLNGLSLNNSTVNSSTFNSLSFDKNDSAGIQTPSLSRLGSIGSISSIGSNFSQQPSFPLGYDDNSSGFWSQPPLPRSSGSPYRISTQPPKYESLQTRPPYLLRATSPMRSSLQSIVQSSAESPLKKSPQSSAASGMKQSDVPTQAQLTLVKSLRFYHDRPSELPRECDRVRMAMFARMLNHMNALPKATLCPLQQDHDPTCPLSHSYLEVMSYNPLYKRLVCRQPSHYWGSRIQEDDSCVCLHVDTGLTWEWMDEVHHKRMHCPRGDKCINTKCFKSHSFEEMCWYNPSYKIKRCTVHAHDHITRARGMIVPPLDCGYYHIEEGKNADKRELTIESDHVGKDIKMLFTERTHKPLADLLEALRYVRVNNL
ncbi:unnamed protein product [Peronospora farinosa]|uniref:C3H1-type domain-containing protein n=1 Tax=Peronospora farinosa TaxID=134698 RepID=A0AAV0SXP9_9STRA|nr:unnamed protein product [Peronospora farinosa]CAI5710416.1 unnamed protein product [Peronospora farinosa]